MRKKPLNTRREKAENYVLYKNPPPLDQWASDTLDNAVQKPVMVYKPNLLIKTFWISSVKTDILD
jgi:hypothetical protein